MSKNKTLSAAKSAKHESMSGGRREDVISKNRQENKK